MLVRLKVDLIVVAGRAVTQAAKKATLSLILSQSDFDYVQVFDNALIHAKAMIDRMR